MTTWLPRWFACLVFVIRFIPVVAAEPDDAEIARRDNITARVVYLSAGQGSGVS